MFGKTSKAREARDGFRKARPVCESLEKREVMSFTAPVGTISGAVTNSATGLGVPNVQIDLFNSTDHLVARTRTNSAGLYLFNIKSPNAYVVYEVLPRGYIQATPSFAMTPPVGSFNTATAGTTSASQSASWNYGFGITPAAGPVGPYAWDTIAPAAAAPFESPVNIPKGVKPVDLSSILKINFTNSVPTDIINNSHQIQIQYPTNNPQDSITLGGVPFYLAQFHYHDPSETTVYGKRYTMEEHFVTMSASGAETVVAVLIQLGPHNNAIQPILDAATASLTKPNTKTTISSSIDFAGLLPSNLSGWFYEGSLTTPPVSQPVNWLVLSTPITLDANQLAQYEAVASSGGFLPNARPSQPLDGRIVNQAGYQFAFDGTGVAGANFNVAANPFTL
jgi:carbonic anhydrase